MERRRSSNLLELFFCYSCWCMAEDHYCSLYNLSTVAFDDICLSPWVMVEKLRNTQRTPMTCTDGLFQGLKLLVTHLIQYCMGVQKSTESLSFDLRSKTCRMRKPTHSKVYPAVSRIETSQNTSN